MTVTGNNAELAKLLSSAQLPALPHSAVKLLELAQDPKNGPVQFAAPIESDPGLTSQVLRFVNSSYFGFRQEISSIQVAISMVGIRTIQNFLLWSAVFSLMPNPKCGPFNLKSLWQDSLRRGIFARDFARRLKLADAEDLFAIALLQDMAVPLLAKVLPTEYQSLFTARENGQRRLSDLERDTLGWTHGEAGALLAQTWSLPEPFVKGISQHGDPEALAASQHPSGSFVIGLSALLPPACDCTWHDRERFLTAYERLENAVGSSVEDLFAKVDELFGEFAPMMKIAQPSKSLVDFLQPETAAA
jgi:HD-like signal output (HDOD) protein